ncbi:MAG: 1,4-alpha-glucan branching protein GlgB [Gordonia sp. (in: high G+C Gram-positive bacteria)]
MSDLWERLGAFPARAPEASTSSAGVEPPEVSTTFRVWAPNARSVAVFGDFDDGCEVEHPMRRGPDGVWETTVPGATTGHWYKYRIVGADGLTRDKADPLARATQCPPETASVIDASSFVWSDDSWRQRRAAGNPGVEAMTIYEVHLPSWRRDLGYRELAVALADHVVALGFTHVQLLPVTEHPYGGSWGYQVSSYFAPTARLGTPDDFRWFVDHLHERGIGVLLDWVPAHFPKDAFALERFDGTPLYEHADPLRREQPDWGTYAFNLGREEIRDFLIASALFWCDEFHLDGLRVDAVAAMLYLDYSRGPGQWRRNERGSHENDEAVDFLRALNDAVHQRFPGAVVIAEESTAWPGVTTPTLDGGLGFDFKWNLGWMHDSLGFVAHRHDDRHRAQERLSFSLSYATSEHFVLPLSHDEVVHGKGTLWTRMPEGSDAAAGVRVLLAYQWAHPGKKLLFMGQEFGQPREWADDAELDWPLLDDPAGEHAGIARLVADLNRLYCSLPALHRLDCSAGGFEWIDANDTANTVIGFLRRSGSQGDAGGRVIACFFNFSDRDLHGYRVGLPSPGRWIEVLNTGARDYAGRGLGNLGAVETVDVAAHGRPCSAELTLPANSAVFFVPA